MGFYLRKSIKVGPLRFNLSKTGLGVSAGVKGLRIGTGPRGNYVHMGRGGLYYRATIPQGNTRRPAAQPSPTQSQDITAPPGTHAPLEEIESADVQQIVDSSSSELLEELNKKRKRMRLWPAALAALVVILALGLSNSWPTWLMILILLAGVGGIYLVYLRDVLAKTVVLFYDFDPDMEKHYGTLHECADRLASCAAAWHIAASGDVHDKKYHAGASTLVNRSKTTIQKAAPPYLKTNIETIAIGVGRQTLHFFPERVLVYDQNGVGAVSYSNLHVQVSPLQFIENGSVPNDAEIVGRTWKYVNKSGGPDRRFKDNTELPVCRYDEIVFSSHTGLNEIIQVSKTGTGAPFAKAISNLARQIPAEHRAASS